MGLYESTRLCQGNSSRRERVGCGPKLWVVNGLVRLRRGQTPRRSFASKLREGSDPRYPLFWAAPEHVRIADGIHVACQPPTGSAPVPVKEGPHGKRAEMPSARSDAHLSAFRYCVTFIVISCISLKSPSTIIVMPNQRGLTPLVRHSILLNMKMVIVRATAWRCPRPFPLLSSPVARLSLNIPVRFSCNFQSQHALCLHHRQPRGK